MNRVERHDLAVETVDSIFDSFSESFRRATALFGSPEKALEKLVFPEIKTHLGAVVGQECTVTGDYTGETRDLFLLFKNGKSWTDTIEEISASVEQGTIMAIVKPGDFLYIPVSVSEAVIDGVEFPAVEDANVKVVVTHVFENMATKESGVVFNFENVLLHAPINPTATNEGGFAKSTLAKYLNGHFLKAVFAGMEQYLALNGDGLKISLPTLQEVFGNENDNSVNWGDAVRHPYFSKCTHRIKVDNDDPNDTNWWWLASATSTPYFCCVHTNGYAYTSNASSVYGVSPAFCVAKRHK